MWRSRIARWAYGVMYSPWASRLRRISRQIVEGLRLNIRAMRNRLVTHQRVAEIAGCTLQALVLDVTIDAIALIFARTVKLANGDMKAFDQMLGSQWLLLYQLIDQYLNLVAEHHYARRTRELIMLNLTIA